MNKKDILTMKLEGLWHIYKMDMWDEDYFNMEVQAFVEVDDRGCGHFQFGLVCGCMDGEIVRGGETEEIAFSWEGNDECDEASGYGRLKLQGENQLEGFIELEWGDESLFWAKRAGV